MLRKKKQRIWGERAYSNIGCWKPALTVAVLPGCEQGPSAHILMQFLGKQAPHQELIHWCQLDCREIQSQEWGLMLGVRMGNGLNSSPKV